MGISSTGKSLNILVTCDYSYHHDWMAFASWYSIYRNLPDAEAAILCARDLKRGYASFDWPYRAEVRFFQHENVGKNEDCLHLNKLYASYVALKEHILAQPLLVVDCDILAVRRLSGETIKMMDESDFYIGDGVWYFNNQDLDKFGETLKDYANFKYQNIPNTEKLNRLLESKFGNSKNIIDLSSDVKSDELSSFVHYNDKCGRFSKKEWLESSVYSPFAYSQQLLKDHNLTANEQQVFKMWNQTQLIYEGMR